MTIDDMVEKPAHYRSHPSGIECIELTEMMPFSIGNACKYVFRRKDKWNTLEDLKKARWYTQRHINFGHTSVSLPSFLFDVRRLTTTLADHEDDFYVQKFWVSINWDCPDLALKNLDSEIARLEAAGDGSQSG